MAEIVGKLIGIFLFSALINSVIKKTVKRDTLNGRFLAVLLSTLLYILIPTFITRTNETIMELIGWISITIICGVICVCIVAFKLDIKSSALSFVYGLGFYFLIGFSTSFLFRVILGITQAQYDADILDSSLGVVSLLLGFVAAIILVANQKLPGTRGIKLSKTF